tara:strand:+ start:154 stop:468 length:315 start_codon:yes stop_codon:yes gene_type:complete
MIKSKIEIYLGRTFTDEEIILRNDGDKDYIDVWNITEKIKPTDEQLNNLQSEAETYDKNKIVIGNRQKEYGSTAEQIEYITENGLEAWQTKVQEIKTKYPKESE